MSKVKMRCNNCGKWFQSANAKEVTCPDCVQKARKEKLALKNTPPSTNRAAGPGGQGTMSPPRPPAPPKPKHVHSGTNQWLDTLNDVKIAQPEQPPPRPKLPPPPPQRDPYTSGPSTFRGPTTTGTGGYRDERPRGPAAYHPSSGAGLSPSIGQRPPAPRQPLEGRSPGARPAYPGGPRTGGPGNARPKGKPKTPKPAPPPKPKREKIPPPPPFVPTPEQVTQVEERYLELAQPAEFDGIRTQIAHELGIPKKAVKKIIKDLRNRQNIPSWWEVQTYKGSEEEKAKIKALYEPYLPVPPIGVHKKIAEDLSLKAGIVYQAIKTIRQEMGLPQYNDPSFHEEELAARVKKAGPPDPEQLTTGVGTTETAATESTVPAASVATQEGTGNEQGASTESADSASPVSNS